MTMTTTRMIAAVVVMMMMTMIQQGQFHQRVSDEVVGVVHLGWFGHQGGYR